MVRCDFSICRSFLLIFLFFLPISGVAEELKTTTYSGIVSEAQIEQGKFIVDGQTYQFDPNTVAVVNSKQEPLPLKELKPGLAVSIRLSTDGKMVTAIEIQTDHFMIDDSLIAEKVSIPEGK